MFSTNVFQVSRTGFSFEEIVVKKCTKQNSLLKHNPGLVCFEQQALGQQIFITHKVFQNV